MQHGRLLAGRPFHPGLLGLAAVHRNSSSGLSEILARSAFEVALSGTNAASCSGEASRGSPCTRFTISSNRASAISDMGMPHATMGTRAVGSLNDLPSASNHQCWPPAFPPFGCRCITTDPGDIVRSPSANALALTAIFSEASSAAMNAAERLPRSYRLIMRAILFMRGCSPGSA